nr:Rnase Y domain-containing protein [Chloroflexota bacterium]
MNAETIIVVIVALIVGAAIGYAIYAILAQQRVRSAEGTAQKLVLEAQAKEKEILLDAKDEALKMRNTAEAENKERRKEIDRQEKRVLQKEESLDRKSETYERKERQLAQKEQKLDEAREQADKLRQQQAEALERIAELSRENAKALLISQVETEVKADVERRVRDMETQIKAEADMRAQKIVGMAIQRCAADVVAETTVSVVNLPNEDMKGRIIGKEGRNIRALEAATGVDLIIDDTPEAVILSSFDPVRREVARVALGKLILDGRIHPARIEEVVG